MLGLAPARHYYLTMEVAMDELIAMRAEVNQLVDVKTSVNDFVIKACAKALVEVPVCNSSWSDCPSQGPSTLPAHAAPPRAVGLA